MKTFIRKLTESRSMEKCASELSTQASLCIWNANHYLAFCLLSYTELSELLLG